MNTSDREIITTRIMDAPCKKVFAAWTNPDQLKHWWGPKGFTNTIHTFELKPGGIWEFTMHGPDGTDYHNRNVFAEIVNQERIVFDHIEPIHTFRVTATFEPVHHQTKLSFRMVFDSIDEYQRILPYVPEANEQNFDRLEALLKTVN